MFQNYNIKSVWLKTTMREFWCPGNDDIKTYYNLKEFKNRIFKYMTKIFDLQEKSNILLKIEIAMRLNKRCHNIKKIINL